MVQLSKLSLIRNATKVNVDEFIAKSNKISGKLEVGASDKVMHKSTASRTRSKQIATPIAKSSHSV